MSEEHKEAKAAVEVYEALVAKVESELAALKYDLSVKKKILTQIEQKEMTKSLHDGALVRLRERPSLTGVIIEKSELGFGHWLVKWDRTGKVVREYGPDLEMFECQHENIDDYSW